MEVGIDVVRLRELGLGEVVVLVPKIESVAVEDEGCVAIPKIEPFVIEDRGCATVPKIEPLCDEEKRLLASAVFKLLPPGLL